MLRTLMRLAEGESAKDLAEYGIALAAIALRAGVAAAVIATNVNQLWSQVPGAIALAV